MTTAHIAAAKAELRTEFGLQLTALSRLMEEKFVAHDQQLEERRARYLANDAALRGLIATEGNAAQQAVKAAFESQRELAAAHNTATSTAISKSEAATTKQMDGIHVLIAGLSKSVDDKLASISARLDRGDGATSQQRGSQTTILAIASIVVGIAGVGVAFMASASRGSTIGPTPIMEAASSERNRIALQLESVARQLEALRASPPTIPSQPPK